MKDDKLVISSKEIFDLLREGKDVVIELYKHSSPEQRNLILKIVGGILGLGLFYNFLRSL